jgi:hypothetical protein
MLRHLLVALAALCLLPGMAQAATLTATPTDVKAQLAAALPGDVVQLRGTGHVLDVRRQVAAPGVIVEPAPGEAVKAAYIYTNAAAGWTFRGFEVGVDPRPYTAGSCGGTTGIPCGTNAAIYSMASERMAFDGLKVADRGGGNAMAVMVRNCRDVAIQGLDISEVAQAISHLDCDGLTIRGNHIHHLRGQTDGIRGVSDNILIEGNSLHDFFYVATHPTWHADAIQFWTDNRTASPRNITIRGNTWRQGAGDPVQGAFLGENNSIPYLGVVIEENAFMGLIWTGIGLDNTPGAIVRRNFVGGFKGNFAPDGKLMIPRISVRDMPAGSEPPVISDNVMTGYTEYLVASAVTKSGNVTIPLAEPGDYGQMDAWLAAQGPTPAPEPTDPRDAEIAALKAQVAVLAGRVEALKATVAGALPIAKQIETLGIQARAARAKNQFIDQINILAPQQVTLLAAPQ